MIYTREAKDDALIPVRRRLSELRYRPAIWTMGIFEIMHMNDELRMMVVKGASTAELRNAALKQGMVTLLKDGMMKVKANQTTPSEILRTAYASE
jgi:type II secretory ATPase GspE/PulE/Tfp pilus assembly ATPase PilB-like protein